MKYKKYLRLKIIINKLYHQIIPYRLKISKLVENIIIYANANDVIPVTNETEFIYYDIR